jgi:hypothetical protein
VKIDKAIEILTINNDHNPKFSDADRRDALKLGIEALKRVKAERTGYETYAPDLLPGETKD